MMKPSSADHQNGHVFISYARFDGRDCAHQLEQGLSGRGLGVWRDTRNIDPYKDFSAEIEVAIEQAIHVVVCLTPSIAERKDSFVRREIIYAQGCQKPITPVVFPGFPEGRLPVLINHLTWLRFVSLEGLLAELSARFIKPEPVPPFPMTDPFAVHLHRLYSAVVRFLDTTVFSLVPLAASAHRTPDEALRVLPISLFGSSLRVRPANDETSNVSPTNLSFSSIREAIQTYDGRLLLLGEPGAGKTTTLMAVARDAIAERLEDPQAPLPLTGRIADWYHRGQLPILDWLADSLEIDRFLITREAQSGRLLLLLDGLDEVPNQERETTTETSPAAKFVDQIAPLVNRHQIIITCRPKDYNSLAYPPRLHGTVTLEPLNDELLFEYLSDSPELMRAVRADEVLREVVRIPLLLSLFRFAYAEAGESVHQLADLAHAPQLLREKVIATYVQRRLEHEQLRLGARLPFDLKTIYRLLGIAAVQLESTHFNLHRAGHDPVPIQETLREQLGTAAEQFVEQVKRLHFLVGEGVELRFIHALVKDHFGSALALAALNAARDGEYPAPLDERRALSLLWRTTDPDSWENEPFLKFVDRVGVLGSISHDQFERLIKLRDSRVIPLLAQALKSSDRYGTLDYVWYDAMLFFQGGYHWFGPIEETALCDSLLLGVHPRRDNYVKALALVGKPSALDALVKSLKDVLPQVRGTAVLAIGEILGRSRNKSVIAPERRKWALDAVREIVDDTNQFFHLRTDDRVSVHGPSYDRFTVGEAARKILAEADGLAGAAT